ncbi:class I SAM-dependent methyltransferase [Mesorhizobium sp. KR9-304]|uniref:class I SAM-dependent methyltransferase n=1 Tax=Mesorhizobium sp. KR9-304 TaxID=3156614 RepID=UPI0032B4E265
MKDIPENHRRMGIGSKARLATIVIRENGFAYLFYLGLSYIGNSLAEFGFRKSDAMRRANSLPGVNSPEANKHIWDNWDWSAQGDEWTPSAEWKQSVVSKFLDPYFANADFILEVGPGAGRWTEYLIPRAENFLGVDISETCIEECRKRFAKSSNATFEVGNGKDLRTLAAASVDRIWSFDVFVHINRAEFSSYVSEFNRVLKPDGLGVIHHGSFGGSTGGWRSNVTLDDVIAFMFENSLEVVSQTQAWTDNDQEHHAGLYGDTITVFRKPS